MENKQKIQVGDKVITIRKWKGKDKRTFVSVLKNPESTELDLMNAICYSCIEEPVVLSIDEFRYVLSRIRAFSLGEEFSIDFYCKKCGELFTKEFKLSEVFRPSFSPVKEINGGNVHIKLDDIKNKEFYYKKLKEDQIYDLLLRIEEFNGDDSFTLEQLIEKFDELDVDVIEKIFTIWEESRFKIDDENEVQCPHCGNVELYKFDEIPGFFPQSWFI